MNEIYCCLKTATFDYFVSTDPNCEGATQQASLGYIWGHGSVTLSPVYRCVVSGDHMISQFPNRDCIPDGYQVEKIIGYMPVFE
jgi:hypothetical protein